MYHSKLQVNIKIQFSLNKPQKQPIKKEQKRKENKQQKCLQIP